MKITRRLLPVFALFLGFLFFWPRPLQTRAAGTVTAVFFYSPTCGSCRETEDVLTRYQNSHPEFRLVSYDISNLQNEELLNRYCARYRIAREKATVPLLFVGDRSFSEISSASALARDLALAGKKATPLLPAGGESGAVSRFSACNVFGVLAAGFVNGLSPCSLSMILFFLSLLAVKREKVLKLGAAFCAGKFIGYLALGTVLFGFLSKLGTIGLKPFIKGAAVLLLLILIFLNLRDFFFARKEQYGRMKLQLPSKMKKWDHRLLGGVSAFSGPALLLFFSFAAGAALSAGEFLCTGQIYLVTIVTVLQSVPDLSLTAFCYLVLYDVGYILPLLALTAAVGRGKEIFELSEFVREHLPAVKLLNALLLAAFGAALLFL